MLASNLFSTLLPSHPDLLPILKSIREKYNFPEVGPDDDGMKEILLSDKDIDWQSVREEIETQVRNSPELLPPSIKSILPFNHAENQPIVLTGLEEVSEELRKQLYTLMTVLVSQIIDPLLFKVNEFYKILSDSLLEFLLTGKPREVPNDWFGAVTTTSVFGEKMVIAIAGQASDSKAISDQFRQEFNKTFGKDRPKITEGNLNTAEYLRMKLSGMPIKDIVDVYIQHNLSQFPKDVKSIAYREAKRKHEEMMKKSWMPIFNIVHLFISVGKLVTEALKEGKDMIKKTKD